MTDYRPSTPPDESLPRLPIKRRCTLNHPAKLAQARHEYVVKCAVHPDHEIGIWAETPEEAVKQWDLL